VANKINLIKKSFKFYCALTFLLYPIHKNSDVSEVYIFVFHMPIAVLLCPYCGLLKI